MSKRRIPVPSPALVIATLALALVLGGTAVAATGGDTAADTKLVRKLAPTLSVKNATTVGGLWVKSFAKKVPNGTGTQESVFSYDGLTLTLSCSGGEPKVQATSVQAGAFVRGSVISQTQALPIGSSDIVGSTPLDVFTTSDQRGTLDLHYLRTDGHQVDVDAAVDDSHTINEYDGCLMEGFAVGH